MLVVVGAGAVTVFYAAVPFLPDVKLANVLTVIGFGITINLAVIAWSTIR